MAKRRSVELLVVRSDGVRIMRSIVPRWAVSVVLGGASLGLVLAATSLAAMYTDYRSLREQRATLSVLLPRATEQQATLEAYRVRARELRAEIAGWRKIRARILEPFGPDAGLIGRTAGIGGVAVPSPGERDADPADVREELTRVTRLIREEGEHLRRLEQFFSRTGKVLASLPSRWPIRGPVNSDFGLRTSPWSPGSEFHSGIDIGAPVGTPVRAPAPGVVAFAGRHPEYGVALVIDHGNDTRSVYGHLSQLRVVASQTVQRGDLVALTGNTGRSSGPHLHYEIQVRGEPVDPNIYLWESAPPGSEIAAR